MTLSASPDPLEKKFLVTRQPGADKRTKIINPTSEGARVFESLTPCFDDILSQCLAGMNEEEIETFTSLMIRLRENLTSDRGLLSDAATTVH